MFSFAAARALNMFYRHRPLHVLFWFFSLPPPTLAGFRSATGTAAQPCVTFSKLAASAQRSRRRVPWFTCRGTPGACGEDRPKVNRFLFPIKGQKIPSTIFFSAPPPFFGPSCLLASALCLLVMADTAVGAQSSFWCQEPAGATRGLNLSPGSLESDTDRSGCHLSLMCQLGRGVTSRSYRVTRTLTHSNRLNKQQTRLRDYAYESVFEAGNCSLITN